MGVVSTNEAMTLNVFDRVIPKLLCDVIISEFIS